MDRKDSNKSKVNVKDEDVKQATRNTRPMPGISSDQQTEIHQKRTPQQQHQGMPSGEELKGKWEQQVGSAKIMWGKLTEDELLKAEGHEQKLAGLVKERYAISRDEAEKQVRDFMKKAKL